MKMQNVIPPKSDNILVTFLWYHEGIANNIILLCAEKEIWDCRSIEKLFVIK